MGYAWSPGGRELWYIKGRVLRAVDPGGRDRAIHSLGANAFLFDISAQGRVLIGYWRFDNRVRVRAPGESTEHELAAPLRLDALSPDGQFLLARVAPQLRPLLIPLQGGDPVQLGDLGHPEGVAVALSRGGRRVLFREPGPPPRLVEVPTGAGEPRPIPLGTVEPSTASWFADDETLLIRGQEPGRSDRLFVKRPGDTRPKPVTPEGRSIGSFALSPDGAWVAVHETPRIRCYPVRGGEPRDVPGYAGQDLLLGWSSDGRFLHWRRDPDAFAVPARLFRLDVRDGRETPWMDLVLPDRTGLMSIHSVLVASGGQAYAYRYYRNLQDLCLVDGLK